MVVFLFIILFVSIALHLMEAIPPQETDPTDFKRRFLKKIRKLGEVLGFSRLMYCYSSLVK